MGGDREAAERPPHEGVDADPPGDRAPRRGVLKRAPARVERDEVGRQARALAVARSETRIVPEGLGVGRQQVARDREAARQELVADLLGRHAEVEDDAFAAGPARAPVVGVALELEAAAGLEADDAERSRSDRVLARAAADRAGALRHDRGRGVGDHRGEERDGLFEIHRELVGRQDVEAGRGPSPCRRAGARSLDHAEDPAALALLVQEQALPGMAHVARRQPPAVVEAHARLEPEAVARAAVLHEHLGREPRDDPGSLDRPGQRLVHARKGVGLLDGDDQRTGRGCARRPGSARAGRRRRSRARSRPLGAGLRGLAELRVVDVGRRRVELDAADGGARDPVVHVVEERHEDPGFEQRCARTSDRAPRGRRAAARRAPRRAGGPISGEEKYARRRPVSEWKRLCVKLSGSS